MRPSEKTIIDVVDLGTRPTNLEQELVRGGFDPEETRSAIEELVADGTLTRGETSSGYWVVVTEVCPSIVEAIKKYLGRRADPPNAPPKSYGHVSEGDALTDGQKEFLLDTEAEDENSEGRDYSDSAEMRRLLRNLSEYRRYKRDKNR